MLWKHVRKETNFDWGIKKAYHIKTHQHNVPCGCCFQKDAQHLTSLRRGRVTLHGRIREADTGLTFLVILVRAGPGARPVLRIALSPRRLLLLGSRTLAEVDPLGQSRQVLRHGQRLQVRLSAIQAHFLDLLLAG